MKTQKIKKKSKVKKKTTNKNHAGATLAKEEDFNFAYSKAPQASSVVKVKEAYQLYINGKFCDASQKKTFNSINPATGKKLCKIALASKKDVDKAVASAKNAYNKTWSKISARERSYYLFRIARLIQEKSRELAVLETMDGGKPIKESRDVDLPLVAAHFFYHAGWADKLQYAFPGQKASPIGVVGQVIPWNFPLLMAAWKIAPALATGNTVVIKPAETTSASIMHLAEIFQEAELPDGVVNIVTGAGEVGAALVNHKDVNKVAFTGSNEVGKLIAKSVASSNKRVTLELGGKSANIVFEDAAIDQAVEGVINGIYFNQGHVCCAGSRLLIEENIKDIFLKKLKRRMQQLRVGDPLDKNTDVGAINSKEQLDKINQIVDAGKKEGLDFYQSKTCSLPSQGYFYKPSFFNGVSSASVVARSEIFGPVLSIQSFRNPEEAIAKANNSPYGLAAGVWSEKGSKILQVAKALKAGVIWSNTYNKFDPTSPFGGYKESGQGREGGRQGLSAYVELQS